MGKRHHLTPTNRSKTLPSSPTHSSSSSSSEFEFAVSPRKSCPADELFYKGQLLPLHIPPRISMVRSLLLSSSSTARDSTGSSSSGESFSSDLSFLASGIDSARRSSITDEDSSSDDLLVRQKSTPASNNTYFSLSRFSNVFKKDPNSVPDQSGSRPVNRLSAKEVIRKYLKKMKPFYQKLSQHKQQSTTKTTSCWLGVDHEITAPSNLNYLRKSTRRSYVASCPSSIGSSPTRSLSRSGLTVRGGSTATTSSGSYSYSDHSTMEELQSAIQGAIAHCKNSLR